MRHTLFALLLSVLPLVGPAAAAPADLLDRLRDQYADSNGVRIHYVTIGRGPLIVMIHGFPDFWYGWREQMTGLSRRYQVAALDLRGYNLSDQPKGAENYDLGLLANDVAAVVRDLGRERATIVGHDWGGAIAWLFAIAHPEMTDRLVVLQTPHPRGLLRELRTNPQQLANSEYARTFQQDGAYLGLSPGILATLASTPATSQRYLDAFARSDIQAMLYYYQRNYPRAPYADVELPKVHAPVLVIHGLADTFLLAAGHNATWDWVDGPVTISTVPGVGHFIQRDAPTTVTRLIKQWLAATPVRSGG